MYVARVPNRTSPPAYLLREGYRENGKVKTRTLANLTHWPLSKIERLSRVLRDEVLGSAGDGLSMLRSLPHGHVAAVLGGARKIGLERLLAGSRAPARQVALVLAMIVARLLDPASKLALRGSSMPPRPPRRSVHCSDWGALPSRTCTLRSTGRSASNPGSSSGSPASI